MFLRKDTLISDEPLLSGQPLLSGHLPVPRGWPLHGGSTVVNLLDRVVGSLVKITLGLSEI